MNGERQERREHQETVCRFVRDVLAARTGEPITDGPKPEDDHRNTPAVEVIWRGASGVEYAVEHTQLESYEGQIQDQVCIRRVLRPVRLLLESRVPGTFELRVKAGAATAVRGNATGASALIAREVLVSSYRLAIKEAKTLQFENLPLQLELFRRHAERSQVFIKCIVEGDSDDLRLNRVKRAIDAKLPKLRTWSQGGRTSVLVLEADDINLSNVFVVYKAVSRVLRERNGQPDIVAFVETDGAPMYGWLLKDGPHFGDDVPMPRGGRCYTEGQIA